MSSRLASSLVALAGVGLAATIAASAAAHARLLTPTPRSTRDDIKGDTLCGAPADNPANAAVTTYKEGQAIQITYEETIQHTGCFVGRIIDDYGNKSPVMFNIDDLGDSGLRTPTIINATLPAGVTCYKCTLQFDQVMSGVECKGTVPDASTYHSCASVRITYADGGVPPVPEGGTVDPTTTPDGGVSTTPAPTDDDHGGMDHDSTGTTGGTKASDDGEDTQPVSALCSVGAVGAPAGFGAALFGLVGLALLRRRRQTKD